MEHSSSGLVREIRRWDLVALVVNSVIGAGIFGLPSTVYQLTGVYSLAAFGACAVLVVMVVLCFAEVTSRFSLTGGPYLYAREVFSPLVAFQIGWLLWLTRLSAFAAISNLLVVYLGHFWPHAQTPEWRVRILAALVVTLTAVNLVGVRKSAVFSNVFTIGKLLPLAIFVVVGLMHLDPLRFTLDTPPPVGDFSSAVLLLVYAFTGFEIPIIAAGEVQDPRRNFPFALVTGIAVVVLMYVLIQFVCIGTLPALATSQRPLADAATLFLGPAGGMLITWGALISMTGTLGVTLLAGSRLPFAMAEQGQLPQWLARTNARFCTPHVSILLSAAVILALALSGTFVHLATLSTIARLLIYASTCIALILLRRRGDPPASFHAPAGAALAVLSLLLIGWLLANVAWDKALSVGIALAVGLVLALCYRRRTE